MTEGRTRLYAGIFVALGIAALIGLSIWLGKGRSTSQGHLFVTFFDESVQGLSKDSSVKYRGVLVGRVHSIDVAPDSRLVQVVLSIDKKFNITEDVMAQLKPVGITGTMFVELDRVSEPEKLGFKELSFPTEYPVIPSKPSDISTIFRGIDDLLRGLRELPIQEIATNLNSAIQDARVLLSGPEVEKGISELSSSIASLNKELSQRPISQILKDVKDASFALQKTLKEIQEAAGEFGRVGKELNGFLSDSKGELLAALRNFSEATKNVEEVTQNLNLILSSGSVEENLLNIEKLGYELTKTLRKIHGILEEFEEQPAGFLLGKERKNGK